MPATAVQTKLHKLAPDHVVPETQRSSLKYLLLVMMTHSMKPTVPPCSEQAVEAVSSKLGYTHFQKTLINIRIVAIVFPLAPVLNVHPAIMAQVMDDTAAVMPTATVTATLDLRMGMLATRLPTN
jgi:hypothetical protein